MSGKARSPSPASSGLLVLGMHRSGTSVLARSLQLAGADIGTRLIGASAGNEGGHWEDAFAVELHERMLARLGRSWDDMMPLPEPLPADVAGEPSRLVGEYLRGDRAAHPLWAVKDPRLCEFGGLWREQAARAGIPLGAVLVIRHPWEVARSLAARDGMSSGQAFLLWLHYTIGALQVADGLPTVVVCYEDFLADWRGAIARIARLPGASGLDWTGEAGAAIDTLVDGASRHHVASEGEAGLPHLLAEVWQALCECARDERGTEGLAARFAAALAEARELLTPLLGDFRIAERKLWERVSRAEAALAALHEHSPDAALAELRELVQAHHGSLLKVVSEDIRLMQDAAAAALQQAAGAEARAAAISEHAARGREQEFERNNASLQELHEQRQALVEAVSGEIRNMSAALSEVVHSSGQLEARARLADSLAPALAELDGRLNRQLQALDEQARLHEQLAKELLESRAGHERLASQLQERESRLHGHEVQLRERDAQLQERDAQLRERSAQLQQREAQLHERSTQLQERDAQLHERSAQLQERDAQLHERSAQLQERDAQLQERDAQLAQARQQGDALSTELMRAQSEVRVLRRSAEKLEQVLRSHSWRWTMPVRVAMRALRGQWGPEDTRALRRVLGREGPGAVAIEAPSAGSGESGMTQAVAAVAALPIVRPMLADALPGLADLFVWAVIDWDFRVQRPQHLARALAQRGHRTFYISNNFVDSPEPGFRVDALDASGRLFQVNLNLAGAPAIYFGLPTDAQVQQLRASLATLLDWTRTEASLSLAQHPYWWSLVRAVPNARLVYDCMDHHAGFDNNAQSVIEGERMLLRDADLTTVTSLWLQAEVAPRARATALVRNACEFESFNRVPATCFRDPDGRKVIGYFGAIAEWFDLELIAKIAQAHRDALVVLVGNDTVGAGKALAGLKNVRLIGEVPYHELPFWLHGFDVALLPFKVIPLTLATNPVKVYEYLAAGKAVVSVDLPEMQQFTGLVAVAPDHAAFVAAVGAALAEPAEAGLAMAREAFAAGQTWEHRAEAFDAAIAAIDEPLVSVVVLTYNNLAFSEACLHSIEAYSDYPNLEVIVVDNASSDGSPEWLQHWVDTPSAAGHRRRLVLNDDNLGFAAGNNVGLAIANGEFLVMLNNDTCVTRGWVRTLCAHFHREPRIGLLGPVTNNIGNEAKIAIEYPDIGEMHRLSGLYTRAHPGERIAMRTVAFFCVAMPRAVYETLGGLDEAFGVGFFEDDDYCRRVEAAGWEIACAEDVFVHHHLSASFNVLPSEAKQQLFERNKATYEAKWGPWVPHVYR